MSLNNNKFQIPQDLWNADILADTNAPDVLPGVPADPGSILLQNDTAAPDEGHLWLKDGPLDTDWTELTPGMDHAPTFTIGNTAEGDTSAEVDYLYDPGDISTNGVLGLAIAALPPNGGWIHIRRGDYSNMSDNVLSANVKLTGDGRGATILGGQLEVESDYAHVADMTMITDNPISINNGGDILIERIACPNNIALGITLNGVALRERTVIIRECDIPVAGRPIEISGGEHYNILIENCRIGIRNGGDGLYVNNAVYKNLTIRNCNLLEDDIASAIVQIFGSTAQDSQTHIHNNYFEAADPLTGVWLEGTGTFYNVIVTNNHVNLDGDFVAVRGIYDNLLIADNHADAVGSFFNCTTPSTFTAFNLKIVRNVIRRSTQSTFRFNSAGVTFGAIWIIDNTVGDATGFGQAMIDVQAATGFQAVQIDKNGLGAADGAFFHAAVPIASVAFRNNGTGTANAAGTHGGVFAFDANIANCWIEGNAMTAAVNRHIYCAGLMLNVVIVRNGMGFYTGVAIEAQMQICQVIGNVIGSNAATGQAHIWVRSGGGSCIFRDNLFTLAGGPGPAIEFEAPTNDSHRVLNNLLTGHSIQTNGILTLYFTPVAPTNVPPGTNW